MGKNVSLGSRWRKVSQTLFGRGQAIDGEIGVLDKGVKPLEIDARTAVSVVIPCYCCSETIGRALASIAAQTMLPHEVLLVEDASPDGGKTIDALRRLAVQYAETLDVKIIALEENSGAASARNSGWEVASQPYIAFLDADDAWHPIKLEIQYGWMVSHPSFGLVGHAHVLNQDYSQIESYQSPQMAVRSVSKLKALFSNPFSTPTVMVKRDIPNRFLNGKRFAEDYLLWLNIILAGVQTAYMDMPLASTYKPDYGTAGLSARLWQMECGELATYWEIYKEGRIGLLVALGLSALSIAKYIRRVVLVKLRCTCGFMQNPNPK